MKRGEAQNRSNATELDRHNMWLRPRPPLPTETQSSTHAPFNYMKPPAEPVNTCSQIKSPLKSCNSITTLGSKHMASTAYFSARPPAAPLILLPITLPGSSTACFSRSATHPQIVSVVRSVLEDLVSALPLRSSPKPSCVTPGTRGARATRSLPRHRPRRDKAAVSPPKYTHSRLSSMSSLHGDRSSLCNVATQAPVVHNARAVAKSASSVTKSDEWLGGVRALRDSHLRLVLRQLRHIDRLNRAVDRVLQPLSDLTGNPL